MGHDVFISHAHKDKDIADAICEKLESAQVSCWMTARDISPGEDRTEATRNAIGSSRVMVLVLSDNANAAPHIEREIVHAFYTRRTIVPIRLANTLPRRDFLFYLGSVRWFNAFSPSATQHLAALTAHIKSLMPHRTAALNGTPHRAVPGIMARPNFSNSWPGALRAPHYWKLGILKWLTVAACLYLLWLIYFAPQQPKEVAPVADNSAGLASSPTSPGPAPPAKGETQVSKSTSTFTRFGLWETPNTGPTPLAEATPQVTPPVTAAMSSPTPVITAAEPSPTPNFDRSTTDKANTTVKAKKVAIQEGATNDSAPDGSPRKITRQAAKLALSRKSDGASIPRAVPLAPDSHHQQDREPERNITWHDWQELPTYELRTRTGERYLGGEDWAHYLGFELAPSSQKVIKVSSIHLQGETAPDRELSPVTRDVIVTIVDHHRTAEKGLWSWTLQAESQDTDSQALVEQGLQNAPGAPPTIQPRLEPFLPQSEVDKPEAVAAQKPVARDSASAGVAQVEPERITAPEQPARPASALNSDGPRVPPPEMPQAPDDHRQEYTVPDRSISWHGWQQLPAYDMTIRTGDHYLGDGSWAHYLGFELAPTSQKVIKVSLIHLEGETVANRELSPAAREAVVKIVNHRMTEERGAWGWTLQEVRE
jgi:TIR domain